MVGSLRPDYHFELPNGKVAVFDITTSGRASKISKYNIDDVTDWLINILYQQRIFDMNNKLKKEMVERWTDELNFKINAMFKKED